MTTQPDKAAEAARRKRWAKVAAVAGALLGAACHFVPPDYQVACSSITKVAGMFLGGCS